MIISKFELNEIKIILAVLHNENISYKLRLSKVWELYDLLRLHKEEIAAIEDGEVDAETLMDQPIWVLAINQCVLKKDFLSVKKMILLRLIELEEYEAIIELGLEKIKL